MREIYLTQNKIAIVDDEDYYKLIKYKWHANLKRKVWYAERSDKDKCGGSIGMHRDILNLSKGDGKIADHIDHNGLNNCKNNLRITDCKGNSRNSRPSRLNKSGFKGVNLDKRNGKWRAEIHIHLGYFDNKEDAAIAYNNKARELYGEFAFLNNITKEVIMPPKKDPTEEDVRLKVRQEGRRGFLLIDDVREQIGDAMLLKILEFINFQNFIPPYEDKNDCSVWFGYCPLFEPLSIDNKTPYYNIRVDLSEPEPIVEVFKRR